MQYRLTVARHGELHERVVTAADAETARRMATAAGEHVVACRGVFRLSRAAPFQTALFTQELIALLNAGLSLVECVEALRDKSSGSAENATRRVLDAIIDGLYQGLPLSGVLAGLPEQFPALYVATVASAERTGHLADALSRYHRYEARLAAVRKRAVSALIYPAVVIAIGGLIMLFLLFFVIPRFSQVYASMRDLPAAARWLLWWGESVEAHGGLIALGLLAAALALLAGARHARLVPRLFALALRIPQLQSLQRLLALTKLYRTTGLLLAGGMAAVPALRLASPLLPEPLRNALARAIAEIETGLPVADTLSRHGLTTPVAERLLRVGERSGELPDMCERAAQFCDEALDRAIDTATKLIEPLLMLVVGGLVGGIVFLLYMPIFELAGNMQ
ncbi:type II secretion system F family protein [Cupriavidus agavae]|uniref:General secretion pathway protein F n=1 Tax=Cupriavidus agavae TaxID=1001822 RepID=A0A4Q7RDK6_9BURK|nr:type II secretion system F family protein [Cupriavidus agavae]RZT31266.1 general secretion pathway protein F [Cupriavidus agavae]